MNFLNPSGFFERGKSTVLLDSLEAFHRNVHNDSLFELGHIDTTFLEVRLAADLAGGVKLGRAGTV